MPTSSRPCSSPSCGTLAVLVPTFLSPAPESACRLSALTGATHSPGWGDGPAALSGMGDQDPPSGQVALPCLSLPGPGLCTRGDTHPCAHKGQRQAALSAQGGTLHTHPWALSPEPLKTSPPLSHTSRHTTAFIHMHSPARVHTCAAHPPQHPHACTHAGLAHGPSHRAAAQTHTRPQSWVS